MNRQLILVVAILFCGSVWADELNVKLSSGERQDFSMPGWENWEWNHTTNGTQKFGNITVSLKGTDGSALHATGRKGLLETGGRMGVSGIVADAGKSGGEIVMTLSGLAPGEHTLATYHNESRDLPAATYDISVDGVSVVKNFAPTSMGNNDADVASTYLHINAVAGHDTVIDFKPIAGGSCIINGFVIDGRDQHKISIKPDPADRDEHVAPEAALKWTAPPTAHAHQFYFGTDADSVARATPQSPEYKGKLTTTEFPLPQNLDPMANYFWRVDEINTPGDETVKGDVWRFQVRSLAFPTAEGYGQFARGGRGGRVIEVTNLNDSGPGSYRAAVDAEGPRTVVFRVSGLIQLQSPCGIRNPYITVAGQTAPGDGICIANYSAGLGTHDAIVRFIRVRIGDKSKRAMDGLGLGGSDNSIIDHCSISWAMDEGTSSRGGHNITFQWNIISEMLQHAYHYSASDRSKFETHAFAGSISGDIGSYHHNLLAHCTDRNWSLAGGYDQAAQYAGRLDIRDNVVYNWTARTTDGGVKELNYVNNYYKPYPKQPKFVDWLLKLDPVIESHGVVKYYMTGNVMEGFDYDSDNWKAFFNGEELEKRVRVDTPIFPSYVKEESAKDAYARVIQSAGAIYPKRDVIDTRIAEEVKTGTVHYQGSKAASWGGRNTNVPGIIDTQDDVKDASDSPVAPWPNYKTYNVPVDSDHDGIPDAWEKANGLNPNDPNDANKVAANGYTNLENYLNSLVGEYPAGK